MPAIGQSGNQSLLEKFTSFFKGNDQEDVRPRVKVVNNQPMIPRSNGQGQNRSKTLAEREASSLGQAMALLTEHGAIREAQSLEELDVLQQKYNGDASLDENNRLALTSAISARRNDLH